MKAIVTLIHGTWAYAAAWTNPDSELCRSLRDAVGRIGAQVEFRTHNWSGSNTVRAREEAAQSLVTRLKQDFQESPGASHFLIAHSHGGNIVVDAARTNGVAEKLSGIITLSTPFVSCRRSGIRVTGVVLGTAAILASTLWIYSIFFRALLWVWNQADSHLSSRFLLWPLGLLLLLLAMRWSGQIGKLPAEALKMAPDLWGMIEGWQDSVLRRFDHRLKRAVPMLCLRFRMDEALIALTVSRLLVKPVRILAVIASWMAAAGGFVLLILWPFGVITGLVIGLLDLVFASHMTSSIEPIFRIVAGVAAMLFGPGVVATVIFLVTWAILGYIMGSLTLGHWGGIVSQLLVDFRITAMPEGAAASARVHSPFRWRMSLRHSLTYSDSEAVAEICDWIATRILDGRKAAGTARCSEPALAVDLGVE